MANNDSPIKKSNDTINITIPKIDINPLLTPISIIFSSILISVTLFISVKNIKLSTPNTPQYECDSSTPLSKGCLQQKAQKIGLDINKFSDCINNKTFKSVIDSEVQIGEKAGLQGTPSYYFGKTEGNNFKGIDISGSAYDEIVELINISKGKSVEDAKSAWVNKKLSDTNAIKSYEDKVRAYFSSDQSGTPLSGQALEDKVKEYKDKYIESIKGIKVLEIAIGNGVSKGDGEYTLMEFSDYECPYCKVFAQDTLAKLENEYINQGRLKFIFRDFPLTSIHKNAESAAIAARCAQDQGKYFDYYNQLFEINK